jgi:hypothetical protein
VLRAVCMRWFGINGGVTGWGHVGDGWGYRRWVEIKEVGGEVGSGWGGRRWMEV